MTLDPAQIVDILRAAGEPTRLRILALLQQGELAVGELAQLLGQSQPRLSHHLKTLSSAGLVERMPEGSWVFYRLTREDSIRVIVHTIFAETDFSSGDFARDSAQLETVRRARAEAADVYFERVADTWDTVRSLHYPNEAIEKALLAEAGTGPFDLVIDIGTGTGRMLSLFSPMARQVEGLDLSHKMLTVARANLARDDIANARVRQADASATPFESGAADLVILHQVLHFIEQPERVIAEASRLLQPGGRLLIVDFAPHSLEFLRTEHAHRHLGLNHAALGTWATQHGLSLSDPRRFDPPGNLDAGLAVQIWTADKAPIKKEAAA